MAVLQSADIAYLPVCQVYLILSPDAGGSITFSHEEVVAKLVRAKVSMALQAGTSRKTGGQDCNVWLLKYRDKEH